MHIVHMNEPQMQQCSDGNKKWYLNGKLHREGAPAVDRSDGTKKWYVHDKLHREDGAAVEWSDGTKMWCLHDVGYSGAEAWAASLLKSRNESCAPHDVDAFLKTILWKQVHESL